MDSGSPSQDLLTEEATEMGTGLPPQGPLTGVAERQFNKQNICKGVLPDERWRCDYFSQKADGSFCYVPCATTTTTTTTTTRPDIFSHFRHHFHHIGKHLENLVEAIKQG